MSVRRTWTSTLAGAFAVPALLFAITGCGGDDSVADPPLSSPPTSSPTEAPHHESAEHFIRRWAAAERRMQNTGRHCVPSELSHGLQGMRELAIAGAIAIYAAGGFIRWGGWSRRSMHSEISADGADLRCACSLALLRTRVDTDEPSRTSDSGPRSHQLTAAASRKSIAGWSVSLVQVGLMTKLA